MILGPWGKVNPLRALAGKTNAVDAISEGVILGILGPSPAASPTQRPWARFQVRACSPRWLPEDKLLSLTTESNCRRRKDERRGSRARRQPQPQLRVRAKSRRTLISLHESTDAHFRTPSLQQSLEMISPHRFDAHTISHPPGRCKCNVQGIPRKYQEPTTMVRTRPPTSDSPTHSRVYTIVSSYVAPTHNAHS